MKKNIHPKKYQVKVILLDGSSINIETTNSTLKTITLDQDISTNPAWTGKLRTGKKKGNEEIFRNKFQGFALDD